MILSLSFAPAAATRWWIAAILGFASLCDSTLLRAQSPKPVDILSSKSPEKLLLPHPTDLDLATFLPKDEDAAEDAWLLLFGLSSFSSPAPPVEPKSLFVSPPPPL